MDFRVILFYLIGVISMVKDLTDTNELSELRIALQKQRQIAEEAAAETRDLYDHSPLGYHSTDPQGVITRMNATELKWLGYDEKEIIGKRTFASLLSAQSAETLEANIREVKDLELELVRKDGSLLSVKISAEAVWDDNENLVVSRSVLYDLTEQRKLERQVKTSTERMGMMVAEKNNFLAMASHDLKSPLNSILGLLNVLKADAVAMTVDQRENVDLIFQAGKNMKAIIEKMLDLRRLEQGKSMIQKREMDLVSLVQNSIARMAILAEKKNIEITMDGCEKLVIKSDPAIIVQILENLISNAVKFSQPGKKVTVCVDEAPTSCLMEIVDEGPGIRPEEAHKVFGKFQKLSARPTGGETSTGLGLSIVKELVAVLDGKVTYQSDPGVRTVFTVQLPAA